MEQQGIYSIFIVSLVTLLIALRWPIISRILYVALIVRITLLLIGNYIIPLPDSDYDAIGFEEGAWERAQFGFPLIINQSLDSNYIKSIIAVPYYLFGRNLIMAQSISLFFGMGSVFLGYLLAKKIWGERNAIKVGWILALFPSLVLYSVLTLREVYACFFLLIAMHGVIDWVRYNTYKSIFIAMSGFTLGTLFHGAIILGGFIFFIFVVSRSLQRTLKLFFNNKISLKSLLIIIFTIIFLFLYFSNKIHIPKLGTFEESIDVNRLKFEMGNRLKGDASYPEWTKVNSIPEFFYKGTIRVAYLLFSPFPWDVKKSSHLIGMIDGFIYMFLIYLVFRNIKVIWTDPALRVFLLILAFYFFIFGVGVSNFGAGTRHRAKFVIELIILAAPLIPRFVFLKKKGNS